MTLSDSSNSIPNAACVRRRARPMRVAVICDFLEENWPSMDLVGDMLFSSLFEDFRGVLAVDQIRPKLLWPIKRFTRPPTQLERLLGRFLQYPAEIRDLRDRYDVFHIVDHSYSHLAHELPAERTVITCHDLDTFRCLLEPERERRSLPYRMMTRHILRGFCKAAHVACDTAATRDSILRHELLSKDHLSVVHNGVHPTFSPAGDTPADAELSSMLRRAPGECTELLHVGSTIPRKRIDLLLRIFAEVRKHRPDVRLIRVGADLNQEQKELSRALGVDGHIDALPHIDTALLAAAYRRSALLLQPSEAEGFGLPVAEAMACGTPVVASDIPALREVGGSAASFCPLGDIAQWSEAVLSLLSERHDNPQKWEQRRQVSIAQSQQFSWKEYAEKMIDIYERVLA